MPPDSDSRESRAQYEAVAEAAAAKAVIQLAIDNFT